MIDPTMEKKTASVFPATFPGAPVIYLNTYSIEDGLQPLFFE